MNKWIRFTKDTGQYKANSFAEVDETVARTFVAMGCSGSPKTRFNVHSPRRRRNSRR